MWHRLLSSIKGQKLTNKGFQLPVFQAHRQWGAEGTMPPQFFVFAPPIYFLPPPPPVFFGWEKVAWFGWKKRLNLWFRPEKAFRFRRRPFFFGDHLILAGKRLAKTFFFLRLPDFYWNFASIQFRNNEKALPPWFWFCPPPPPPISRSWRHPCSLHNNAQKEHSKHNDSKYGLISLWRSLKMRLWRYAN